MAKFWGTHIDEHYVKVICALGPLVYFEGYLSVGKLFHVNNQSRLQFSFIFQLYGSEWDFWSDMNVAIEDLAAVNFTLVRHDGKKSIPLPKVTGSRQSLVVYMPIPDYVYAMFPPSNGQSPFNRDQVTFKVTPVFFNIGINEIATLAESLGYCKEQYKSNYDNLDKLKRYFIMHNKIPVVESKNTESLHIKNFDKTGSKDKTVASMLEKLEEQLRTNQSKNVKVLHAVSEITRNLSGLRVTSCKSAKDRTGMAGENHSEV